MVLPSLAGELPNDSAIRLPDEDFQGVPNPSAVSSDDGSSLFEPPPAYGQFPQSLTGGVGCE
jgi:hypothetical protein